MTDRNSNKPIVSGWQATCYLIAIPIVYLYDQQLYEALIAIGALVGGGPSLAGGTFIQKVVGPLQTGNVPVYVGLPLALLAIVGGVIFLIIFVILAVVVGIPLAILWWLATNPRPVRHVCDVGLVWIVGTLLYGVVFPLLWMILAPMVAFTFGEIIYRRLRARVYGDRARFAQPLYLLVSIVSLTFGVLRLLAPAAEAGQEAWQVHIHEAIIPLTPTPNPWPKSFSVRAGETLHTGVSVSPKDEVQITTTAHLKVGLTPSQTPPALLRRTDSSGADCYAGGTWAPSCRSVHYVFFQPGELTLFGGDEAASVQVWPPAPLARHWFLKKGEVYSAKDWIDPGDSFFYGSGQGLSFRVVNHAGASPWQELPAFTSFPDNLGAQQVAPRVGGHVEVRADRVPTWFIYLRVERRGYWRYTVTAERLLDTGIQVRRGDRFSVQVVQKDPLYLMRSSGPYLLQTGTNWEETADYDGTVRLKGGLTGTQAVVHIESRGAEWK